MNEDLAPFELAKKLKDKGFECMYPIAMYNEKGVFHELYTSVGNMQYYDYDDFDERDTIAPTISQVLKWLREEKKLHLEISFWSTTETWSCKVVKITNLPDGEWNVHKCKSYEDAAEPSSIASMASRKVCT